MSAHCPKCNQEVYRVFHSESHRYRCLKCDYERNEECLRCNTFIHCDVDVDGMCSLFKE